MNIKKTILLPVTAAALAGTLLATGEAYADTSTELLDILKSKGTLTNQEYDTLAKGVKVGEKPAIKFNDSLSVSSSDGQNSISFGGRVQADYRMFGGDDAQNADTFDIRRAYLQAKGKAHGKYKYLVIGNFAGSSASLVYAYVDANFSKAANLQIGQFKMPMGLEELTSSRFINFQERSLPMQFVPAIDRGMMLHGEPVNGLYYGIAVSNGSGANTKEKSTTEDGKDISGRLALNLAKMLEIDDAIFHFGGSFSQGEIATGGSGLSSSTEAKGVKFFKAVDFGGDNTERTRLGLEAALAYKSVKFQSEYVSNGFEGRSTEAVAYDRDLNAQYFSLSWMATGEDYASTYKGAKFNRMRPKQNFGGNDGWGAWEIGLRYSRLDASDFKSDNADGTGVLESGAANKADAWTLGVKWIHNPSTRYMLNYVNTRFDSPVAHSGGSDDQEEAITFRAQVDF